MFRSRSRAVRKERRVRSLTGTLPPRPPAVLQFMRCARRLIRPPLGSATCPPPRQGAADGGELDRFVERPAPPHPAAFGARRRRSSTASPAAFTIESARPHAFRRKAASRPVPAPTSRISAGRVWKQVDKPAVDGLGRYKLITTRYMGNILVVPANGVGHHPLDCSHPRSLKAERSTPGGAYHPAEPYRAPSFMATSLLP